MTSAVLLRVLSDQAGVGNLVGRGVVVETGETFAFRDATELTAFLLEVTQGQPAPVESPADAAAAEAPA